MEAFLEKAEERISHNSQHALYHKAYHITQNTLYHIAYHITHNMTHNTRCTTYVVSDKCSLNPANAAMHDPHGLVRCGYQDRFGLFW